jgi:hypothetical protein
MSLILYSAKEGERTIRENCGKDTFGSGDWSPGPTKCTIGLVEEKDYSLFLDIHRDSEVDK